MNDKIFYDQEETCPVCQKKFNARKVRRSMCMVSKRDTDFCVTYQNVNPNLYSIWVCPHCGYAASDAAFAEVSPGDQQKLAKGLAEMGYAGIDFSGERDTKKAVVAYERAVKCAEIRGAKNSVFASLYLRTAWLYRAEHDPKEAEFVQKALEAYEKAFNSESMPIGKMSEVAVSYLIGELCRRLGNPAKAVQWFSQVVSNPKARMEPQMLQLARDGWQESRGAAKNRPPTADGGPAAEAAPAAPTKPAEAAPPAAKPVVAFVSTQSAQAPAPPAVAGPKMRAKVVSVLTIYADQAEWLKKVSSATRVGKKRLDPQAIVRALLDSVIHVEPKLLKGQTEQEMLGLFKAIQAGRPAQPTGAARAAAAAKAAAQPHDASKAAGGTA
ncbi:MAG: DUF2225 domain-containing protein [Bacillota bacterium]